MASHYNGRGNYRNGSKFVQDNEKNYFHLPKVLYHRDRYCTYCGKQVKEDWQICRDSKCKEPTTPRYPDVGPQWSLCPKCSMSFLHESQRFCGICHHRTPAGEIWQVKATKLNRMIFEMQERFRRGELDVTLKNDEVEIKSKSDNDSTISDGDDSIFENIMLGDEIVQKPVDEVVIIPIDQYQGEKVMSVDN